MITKKSAQYQLELFFKNPNPENSRPKIRQILSNAPGAEGIRFNRDIRVKALLTG
jgi:hypothetical protein